MRTSRTPFLAYLASLLLFGSNGIVASRIALSSYEIVFTRTLIGSLFLALIFLLSGQRLRLGENHRHLAYLGISGVAMGASWMFLYEAYVQTGVSIASLLYYTGPVIVMALSPLLFRERLTASRLLGFAAVLGGLFLVNGQALAQGRTAWGLFCGMMAAVTYAFMVIFNKKASRSTGLEKSLLPMITSFLTVAIFVGLRQGFAIPITRADLPPILFLGIVNTAIGCYFYFSSIGRLPVQSVAILGYLEPLSALLFSAALLGERLSPLQVLGAALILGGAAFGELRGQRREP